MALPTITLNNQTGGDIVLTQLAVTVPGSGSITISDFDRPDEVLNDVELQAHLDADTLSITISGGGLSSGDVTKTVEQTKSLIKPLHDLDIKHNLAGTVDPTVTDDEDAGYSINSFWMNTTSQDLFVCYAATSGAAVWGSVSGGAGATVIIFSYGGKFNTPGRKAVVNGPASSASTTALNESSEVTSPAGVSTVAFVWHAADADATTVFTLLVNGVFGATLALTGAFGSLFGISVSISVDDLLAIEYTSGALPNNTNCQLILVGD